MSFPKKRGISVGRVMASRRVAMYRMAMLTVGATMNMFEVTTLGQPLEVLKTQMAANRSQTMGQAFRNVWSRGGVAGFYQGLIPWVGH